MLNLELRALVPQDFDKIVAAFTALGWNKPRELYETYFREQAAGLRSVVVGKLQGEFVGYVTILWTSTYPNFFEKNIPEVCDLNVLPQYRRQGIGARFMQECEAMAREKGCKEIGLGVGLIADYGSAQRLYFRLGYMPDGHGLHQGAQEVAYYQSVVADDSLALYLSKAV